MRMSFRRFVWIPGLLLLSVPAAAQTAAPISPLTISFLPAASASPAVTGPALRLDDAVAPATGEDTMAAAAAAQSPRPVAFEYSDAYNVRARIHRIASFATLPLFATEAIVGESLYTNPTPGKRTTHLVVAGAIAGLFGINSVTGVWNLLEARHDPEGRGRRLAHGILMLAADAGFLATAMTGPGHEHEHGMSTPVYRRSPATHRAIAFASISTASVGYVLMLFGGH
jgi:hypothetical protein